MRQNQIIIVEGPDGAGKTTFIKKVLKGRSRLFRMRHHGAYIGEQDIAKHYLKSMWPAFTGKHPVIMDRCWLAEPIYGQAFRQGQDRIGVAYRRMLERVALTCRGAVILCLPPFSVCAKAFKARLAVGKEYLDHVDTLKKVYDGYKLMNLNTDLTVTSYDWRKSLGLLDGVFDFLELARPIANGGPGVGHWQPGEVTLIVGEQLRKGLRRNFPPFVDFTREGCSAWLAEQLERAGVPESKLYWVNAHVGGKPIDSTFIGNLRPRRIIALGTIATNWCDRSSHKFDSVPHPQYWKRFKSSEPYPLINLLKEKSK